MTEGNRQREQESKRAQYRPPRARYLKQDAALKANLVAPHKLIKRTGRRGAKPPEPWHRSTPKPGLNEDTDGSSTPAALAARCGLGCESALAKSGFARRFRISPIDRRAASAAPMGQSESRPSPVEGYPQSGCHLDASFPRTQHADGGASIRAVSRALLPQGLSYNVGHFGPTFARSKGPCLGSDFAVQRMGEQMGCEVEVSKRRMALRNWFLAEGSQRRRQSREPYRRKKIVLERVENVAKGKTPDSISCE